MKANILHTLIIAILLISGWTLFTVFQDLTTSNPEGYSKMSLIGKTSQYLPVVPEKNYSSSSREYPVYKGTTRVSNANGNSYRKISSSDIKSTGVNSGMLSSTSISDVQIVKTDKQVDVNPQEITPTAKSGSNMVKPFSKTTTIDPNRNIAMNSSSTDLAVAGGSSDKTGLRRVFGGDDEGDDIEDGGGNENEDYYNDMPVGDGLYLLLFMSFIYFVIKFKKNI
jgi:hypothetical protein